MIGTCIFQGGVILLLLTYKELYMKFLLTMVSVLALPAFAADLQTSDITGVTFWLVTAAMLAATVFFFVERDRVHGKWKTSLSVAGLVTGVAFWHYLYMSCLLYTSPSPRD